MRFALRALDSRLVARRNTKKRRGNREALFRRPSFEPLEPRQMLAADDLYYVSGSPSSNYTVRLTKTGGDATFNNELNVFVVDDYTDSVNGVAPGYNSYFNAVKSLPAGVERWTAFNNQTPNNTTFDISVPGGTYLSFFTVQNGTVAGAKPATTWFADASANSDFSPLEETGEHYSATYPGAGVVQFGVEDRAVSDGGDNDLNDLLFKIETPTISYSETIGVVATDAEAFEIAPGDSAALGKATFTFSRSGGSLAAPMTLYFVLGGTETNGIDYVNDATSSPVGNSITIPAFQSSAALVIRTLNDKVAELFARVSVTLVADDPTNPSDPPNPAPIYPPQADADLRDNDIDGYNPHRGCADGSCGPVSLNKQNGEAQIDLFGFHFNSPEPNPVSRFSTPLPSGLGAGGEKGARNRIGGGKSAELLLGPSIDSDNLRFRLPIPSSHTAPVSPNVVRSTPAVAVIQPARRPGSLRVGNRRSVRQPALWPSGTIAALDRLSKHMYTRQQRFVAFCFATHMVLRSSIATSGVACPIFCAPVRRLSPSANNSPLPSRR